MTAFDASLIGRQIDVFPMRRLGRLERKQGNLEYPKGCSRACATATLGRISWPCSCSALCHLSSDFAVPANHRCSSTVTSTALSAPREACLDAHPGR